MKYLTLLLVVGGCAKAGIGTKHDGGGSGGDLAPGDNDAGGDQDLATADDLAGVDFAGLDFSGVDFAGTVDLLGMCTLLPQSGCGANEKCAYDGTGNVCVSVGTVATGKLCGASGSDDCVKGDECVSAGATGTVNDCRQFCNTDNDCTQGAVNAGPTSEPTNKPHCLLTLTGTTASLCSVACNPVAGAGANGCAAGLGCQTWASTSVPEFTDCGPIGTVGDGGNCPNGNSDCQSGFVCVQNAGPPVTQHCRKACRQAAGFVGVDCPGGGYACVHATTATMFGFCCPGTGC